MTKYLFKLLCGLVLFVFPLLAYSNGLETAKKTYSDKNYTDAYTHFLQAAQSGDHEAQYMLGNMLISGTGIAANRNEGMKWLEKSASYNYVPAQVKLGTIYYEGDGIFTLSDYSKALDFFTKAANDDNPEAFYMLGKMYCKGKGVNSDCDTAQKWLLKASNLGNADASYYLAELYLSGKKVKYDPIFAKELFEKAAKNNSEYQFELAKLYESGEISYKVDNGKFINIVDMDPNYKGHFIYALEWYTKGAKQGNLEAAFGLASILTNNPSMPHHYEIALAVINQFKLHEKEYEELDEDDVDDLYENLRELISNEEYEKAMQLSADAEEMWKAVEEVRNQLITNVY